MKSLKERLEERIENAGQYYQDKGCIEGQMIFENARTRWALKDYKEGAASLVPLVVELAGALDWYSRGDREYDLLTKRAKEALQSIEKFIGGK